MAVQDKFVNSLIADGKKAAAIFAGGSNLKVIAWNFEVAAADDDASVFRIGRIPANAIPIYGELYADALTSGTDWDLGLYKPGVGGAVGYASGMVAGLRTWWAGAVGTRRPIVAVSSPQKKSFSVLPIFFPERRI